MLSEILDNRHMKAVRLSVLRTAAFTPRIYSCYSFLLEAQLNPEPRSMKNLIGNRTRDLPPFREVRQVTAVPHASIITCNYINVSNYITVSIVRTEKDRSFHKLPKSRTLWMTRS